MNSKKMTSYERERNKKNVFFSEKEKYLTEFHYHLSDNIHFNEYGKK